MLNSLFLIYTLLTGQEVEKKTVPLNFPEKEVKKLVEQAMEYWRVPGLSIVIVHQGETVYESGFGVVEISKPALVTPQTIFPIASCSKAFTTSLAASLIAKKKLDWDDKVLKHLPWFKLSDALASEDCRLRDLFSHRTGLGGHDLLWYRSKLPPEENVRMAAFLPLEKPFRSSYQYQSTLFAAGGLVCEKVGGSTYEKLLKQEILDPLKMTNTFVVPPKENLARGHALGNLGFPVVTEPYLGFSPNPSGSVYSTAHDLSLWLKFQLDPANQKYANMNCANEILETQKPQIVNPFDETNKLFHPFTVQMAYGMGWVIQDYRGARQISHGGSIDGFRLYLTMIPDSKFGIAILANMEHTRMNLALSNSLIDLLFNFQQVDWHSSYANILVKTTEKSKFLYEAKLIDLLKKYPGTIKLSDVIGEYYHPAYGKAELNLQGKKLRLVLGNLYVDLDNLGSAILYGEDFVFENPICVLSKGSDGKIKSFKISGRLNAEFTKLP